MSYELAERDLVHIRNVLGYLECTTRYMRETEAGAVVSLNYWRTRVRMIMVTPLLPMHIEKQAQALLGRLDNLEAMRHTDGTTSDANSLSAH